MPPTAAASHGAQGAVRVSSKTLFLVLFVPRRRKEGVVRHFPPFATKIGEEALKEKWSKYAWKAPPLLSPPFSLSPCPRVGVRTKSGLLRIMNGRMEAGRRPQLCISGEFFSQEVLAQKVVQRLALLCCTSFGDVYYRNAPLPLMHSRRVVGWLVGQLDAQERRPEVFAAAETISQEMNVAPSSVHNLGISKWGGSKSTPINH